MKRAVVVTVLVLAPGGFFVLGAWAAYYFLRKVRRLTWHF